MTPPTPIEARHDCSGFECGEPALDDWLRRRALHSRLSSASRTFVITRDRAVIGFHSLAVGAVAHSDAPPGLKRNMPDPVPVMILGRLAVHRSESGAGLGAALLRDAVLRTLAVSEQAGLAALLVQANGERAAAFYERHGFRRSPIAAMTLMLSLREIRASI